jgi:phage baseplate assembly protein W
MATTYKGFSTQAGNKNFRLTDFDLIKQDILNHFNIRKGEKLMRPNFGTIIWNVLHEPFTEDLKSVITQDVKAIASYDPRVSFDNIIITEFDQGIQIELQLRYVLTNQTNVMLMNFDGTTNQLTTNQLTAS